VKAKLSAFSSQPSAFSFSLAGWGMWKQIAADYGARLRVLE
jgi:hypothetical protein